MSSPTKLLVLSALVSCAFALTGCGKDNPSAYSNQTEADQAVMEVANLTAPVFDKMIFQEPLSEADVDQLEEALPIARDLHNFAPQRADYTAILGKTLLGLGKRDEARSVLRELVQTGRPPIRDDSEALLVAGIYADLAQIAYDDNLYDLALQDIDQARALAPQDPGFLTLAARIWVEKDDLEEAQRLADLAVEADPGFQPAVQLQSFIKFARESEPSPSSGSNDQGVTPTDAP